jgi:uncharacterized damage-inducible protein DinB
MTEKEMFLQTWEREFQTTLKVLKAYPANRLDLKPAEKSRSAKELLWTFALEEKVFVTGAITGQFDFQNVPKAPATLDEIVSTVEQAHKENVEKVRSLSDEDFEKTVKFMVAPKQVGDVRRGDMFQFLLSDMIHHRGQLSVYLRMAGGKVPSIYGPSADEPWM